jgi:hypothetical protein
MTRSHDLTALPRRWRRRLIILPGICVAIFLGILLAGPGCKRPPADRTDSEAIRDDLPAEKSDAPGNGPRITFRELARAAGINFKHVDSPSGMHYVPEIMGGGAAWLDYDRDGFIDLLLVQGGKFPLDVNEKKRGPMSRLYHNNGDGTFTDVTEQSGIWHPSFGQGVAVGDYDNDGYPDLFIACYGHCHLYHNEPDGKGGRHFREVTREAGVELDGWCTSCAFGDVHGAGYLDLFVCRYTQLDLQHYPYCGRRDPVVRYTCGPKEFLGKQSVLFRNNGNGTFTNVSGACVVKGTKAAGLDGEGKALAVVIVDFDDDGKQDIFVGDDEVPNHYYRNLGGGKFESTGLFAGNATNWHGSPMGSMGVEAGDLLGHGRPDIFITTFFNEGTTLFRNNGSDFTDVSLQAGMQAASWNMVGWGTCLLDPDLGGKLDIVVVNGHVYRNIDKLEQKADIRGIAKGMKQTFPQNAQFFLGDGKGHFQLYDAGAYFQEKHVGRGLAMGDYDNDGHMDIAINNCGEPAALLHDETPTTNHWIRLVLEGNRHVNPGGSNRDALGAKVTLTAGGKKLVRFVKSCGSYLSAHDTRLLVGLGEATHVDDVEVKWPNQNGTVQRFAGLEADRSYKLVEGAAAAVPANCPFVKKRSEN